MNILIIFIYLYLGGNIKFSLIYLVLLILLSIFIYLRFKKIPLIPLLVALGSCLCSYINISTERKEFVGIVVLSKENYIIYESNFERFYVYSKDNSYEIGDVLYIKGYKSEVDFPHLESDFDFNQYLNELDVNSKLIANNIEYKFKTFFRSKALKKDFLNSIYDENTRNFMSSLLFSDRADNNISSNLESLHLYRLMTSSGVYVSFLLRFIEYLLKKRLSENKSKVIANIILLPYFLVLFPKLNIIRCLISFSIFLFFDLYKKKKLDYLTRLGLIGIISIILFPHNFHSLGFPLIYFTPIYFHYLSNALREFSKGKRRLYTFIYQILYFLPCELFFYHSVSLTSNIFSLLLTPLMLPCYFLGILGFYTFNVVNLFNFYFDFIYQVTSFFIKFNFEIYASNINEYVLIIYYLAIFASLFLKEIKFKEKFVKPELIYVGIILLSVIPNVNFPRKEVTFINIGQGDSTLIRDGYKTALVDTGGSIFKDIAKDVLIPYFKSRKIYHLDYVIITHNDYDHVGALESLNQNFRINHIIRETDIFPLKLGSITLNSLNDYRDEAKDENDRSIVLNFKMNQTSFLLMGDAGVTVEKKIIKDHPNLKTDILKLGHHGSNTSSCYEFLKQVDPDVAIASCGKNNKYGHPNEEVLIRLKRLNIPIRRTDIEGTISYFY